MISSPALGATLILLAQLKLFWDEEIQEALPLWLKGTHFLEMLKSLCWARFALAMLVLPRQNNSIKIWLVICFLESVAVLNPPQATLEFELALKDPAESSLYLLLRQEISLWCLFLRNSRHLLCEFTDYTSPNVSFTNDLWYWVKHKTNLWAVCENQRANHYTLSFIHCHSSLLFKTVWP